MASGKLMIVSLIFAKYAGAASTEATTMCELPIDLVVLQDTTGSFVDSLPIVAAQIPSIVSAVKAAHPGSRFGAVEFKDKPYRDLGEPDDYCYRIAATITSDEEEFQEGYSQLYASGGGDVPEAMLQALISTVLSTEIGWRPLLDADSAALRARAYGDATEISGAHLVVLSTDATPHDPGDYQFYNGVYDGYYADEPYPPTVMPDFPDTPADYSADDLCTVYDYPSMEQAAEVVKASGAYVVFLVPEDEEDAVEHWKTFNTDLGQPDAFVRYIKHDSSDIARLIIDVADEFAEYICNQSTSTSTSTEADTTTVPTTLTTTIVDYTTTDSTGTLVTDSTAPATSAVTSAETVTGSTSPVSGSTSPVTDSTSPVSGSTSPVSGSTSPVTDSTSPVSGSTAPVTDTTAPVSGSTAPVTSDGTVSGSTTPETSVGTVSGNTSGEVETTTTAVTEITTPFTSTLPSTSSATSGTTGVTETDTVRTRPETQPDEPETPTHGETTTASEGGECQCDDGAGCGCPAVVIKIQDRPKSMHLDVEN